MEGPVDVPPHLRKYVVTQDYDVYTVVDQAVWRFVLLQTYARLLRTAHPAFEAGFDAAGISVERIPRITEMSERLARASFRAVCVDGFIPPRAFQAFQARGLLPIAADIRTTRNLAYTPAPDIIHEAAGHAPFLAHPEYARYLRKIGSVGERAFSDAHDRAVYEAVYLLSELKEDPSSTREQVARAEANLAQLSATPHTPSEAALLSRLYWWTVEYGLVGNTNDYRLYGAGLLSSLGEGHFCHEPTVRKLPLDAGCLEYAYDITRPQPQLFVARDFEQLEQVLDAVARGFAFRVGGLPALQRAQESGEAACLETATGAQLIGTVRAIHGDAPPDYIELTGACAVAFDDEVISDLPRPERYVLPLGADETLGALSSIAPARLLLACGATRRLSLRLRNAIVITGELIELRERAGRVFVALVRDCTILRGDQVLLHEPGSYPLLFASAVSTAHAQLPLGYFPSTEFPEVRVPRSRNYDATQRAVIDLYERALAALRERFGTGVVPRFEAIYRELCAHHPDEWLLRWNLLESLIKLGDDSALKRDLYGELEQLEIRFGYREPIATGLAYLRGLGARG